MPALTSTSQASHNADRVVAALSDAGVPHLRHRARQDVREVVAVPASHHREAVEALRASPWRAHVPARGRVPLASALADWTGEPDGHVWLHVPADDPRIDAALGPAVACELQLWAHDRAVLEAPRPTPWGRWFDDTVLAPGGWPPPRPADEVDFPVDVVYTWVDDTDPDWEARRDGALRAAGRLPLAGHAAGDHLFRNRDELRYSMRSLVMYAPFFRHVYLVTAGQRPSWLVPDHPRLTVVDHRDIFTDPSHLPTFNSHAIEANLHHVEGLAEHYLYLNDDAFFGRPVRPELFFHANGISKTYLSKAQVPPGDLGPGNLGVDVAASNGRRLIERELGVRITQKLKHTPHAQRRSVLERLERLFPDEFAATSSHPFRDVSDVSVPSSLAQHYGLLTGTTTHGARLHYDYIYLEDLAAVSDRLDRLQADRDLDVFCLNDAGAAPQEAEQLDARVLSFLEDYFPVPSEFERG